MMNNTDARNPAPISAHRYFPAIVALWFAALFGLGSLVLPAALPEMIVTSLGLDTLVPALAPPHGFTARISIALAATIIGGAAGWFLSRKIAATQAQQRPSRSRAPCAEQASAPSLRQSDKHADAPARRPISALEELGEDRLADAAQGQTSQADDKRLPPATLAGRRRALALPCEDGPSDWSQHAPLPGISEIPADLARESQERAEFSSPAAPHWNGRIGSEPVYNEPLELEIEEVAEEIAVQSEPDQPVPVPRFEAAAAAPLFAKPVSHDTPVMAAAQPAAADPVAPRDLPAPNSFAQPRPLRSARWQNWVWLNWLSVLPTRCSNVKRRFPIRVLRAHMARPMMARHCQKQ
jgi:hypothetical protein